MAVFSKKNFQNHKVYQQSAIKTVGNLITLELSIRCVCSTSSGLLSADFGGEVSVYLFQQLFHFHHHGIEEMDMVRGRIDFRSKEQNNKHTLVITPHII